MVIQFKKDRLKLEQSLLHTLELAIGDKNEIYRLSLTLFSEVKFRAFDLIISNIFGFKIILGN